MLPPQVLTELQAIASNRKAISTLRKEGLIAPKNTRIMPYKAKGADTKDKTTGEVLKEGKYYDYYKLVKGTKGKPGGQTVIHLGSKESPWYSLIEKAIERRDQIDTLQRKIKQGFQALEERFEISKKDAEELIRYPDKQEPTITMKSLKAEADNLKVDANILD